MIGKLKYTLVMLAIIASYTWVLVRVTPRWFAHVVTAAVVVLSVWRAARTGEWGLRASELLPALREAGLMTVAAAGAWCWIYDRHPNLLPLAVSHALCTLVILCSFDPVLTGRLRVGYSYLQIR